jgi:hypothetical protein
VPLLGALDKYRGLIFRLAIMNPSRPVIASPTVKDQQLGFLVGGEFERSDGAMRFSE